MRHSGLSRAPSGVPSSKNARRYHWPSQPAFSSRAARPARSLSHCRANDSSLMPARQRRELAQHFAQEESEPDAFAAALVPDAIHAVVPVAGADQRQTVCAVALPMLNRSPRVLVQARRLGRAPGHVVPRLLVRRHRWTVEESHGLVEHAGVVGRLHVPAQRERQPQVIVRNARANAAPRRRMPPVLNVALDELSARTEQQVLAQHPGPGVDHRHRVLQLIAEAERPAGLVVAAAGPHPAGDGLVHQPAVGQQVQRRIGRGDLHGAQCMAPVRIDLRERRPRRRAAAVALHQLAGLVGAAAHAKAEDDLPRLARRQLDRHLDRAARVEPGTGATRQARPAHRRRPAQRAIAADELVAVGGDRSAHAVGRGRRRRMRSSRRSRCCSGCARRARRCRTRSRCGCAARSSRAVRPAPTRRSRWPRADGWRTLSLRSTRRENLTASSSATNTVSSLCTPASSCSNTL